MKLKNLLIFGSLLLVCSSLSAQQIVDGVRVEPTKPAAPIKPLSPSAPAVSTDKAMEAIIHESGVDLTAATPMYMYNVTAKKFFLGANNWNTTASAGDEGYQVVFEKVTDDNGDWDGKTVLFHDYAVSKSGWKNVFFNGVDGSSFVDRGSQANYHWVIEKVTNGYYRLSMAETNNPDYKAWTTANPNAYFGLEPGRDCGNKTGDVWNEVLNTFVTEGEGKHIDWMFISQADYETYINSEEYIQYTTVDRATAIEAFNAGAEMTAYNEALATYNNVTIPAYNAELALYNASVPLKEQIDEAKARGIDVAAQVAVYENMASTAEDITAAIDAIKAKIAEYDAQNVDPKNPVDKTTDITNPTYADNNGTGWSGTAFAFQTYGNAEFYNKNYNAYQDLANMPNGVYAVSVQAYYRAGSVDDAATAFEKGNNNFAKLYAKTGADSLNASIANIFAGAQELATGIGDEVTGVIDGKTYYIPNTMQSAVPYLEMDVYKTTLFFSTEDGNIRFGVKKDSLVGTDWTIFDDWTLTYYGSKPEAFTVWFENVIANAPKFDAAAATAGMVEAYDAMVAGLSGNDKATIIAASNKIETESAKVLENIAAWAAYEAEVARAVEAATDPDLNGDLIIDLGDYCDFDAEDILDAREMTTEEIVAETEKLTKMIDEAIVNSIEPGTDVTNKFLKNPNYEQSKEGWMGNPTIGGTADNKCAEAYEINFDVYQEVKDAPAGVYEVEVQGFYRDGLYDVAWSNYLADPASLSCPVEVYVNNNATPIPSPFDEKVTDLTYYDAHTDWTAPAQLVDNDGVTYVFPNGMTSCAIAFTAGKYKSSAFGLVAKKGDVLRLGIRKQVAEGNVPTGNWAIWDNFRMIYRGKQADVIAPYLESAIVAAQENLTKELVSPGVKTIINEAIAAGQAAGTTDGDAMFEALIQLYASNDSVLACIALMQEAQALAEEMYNWGTTYPWADPLVIEEAMILADDIMDGMGTYEMEDARQALAKVEELRLKAKLPVGYEDASDDNTIDFTHFIESASFENAGTNSIAGWQGTTGYNFGNDDTQKSALALEYYEKSLNMYQEISGLPNGTYKVTVQAFNRFGSTADDYHKYVADPTQTEAYLYAVGGGETIQSGIQLLYSGAVAQMLGVGSEATVIVDTVNAVNMYVPNDMVSASAYFSNGSYKSELYVNVTDGTLRIGMKKDEYITGSWLIMDNFTLTYHGTNSAFGPTGIEEVIGDANVVSVEVYNLNGVKVNKLQQGLNIVKSTLEDGRVIVRKTFVK